MTILPFSHSQFVLNPNVFFPLKHKTSNFEKCPSCCFPGSQSEWGRWLLGFKNDKTSNTKVVHAAHVLYSKSSQADFGSYVTHIVKILLCDGDSRKWFLFLKNVFINLLIFFESKMADCTYVYWFSVYMNF